jgi:predicted Co/Zn/Cd cation transporter (cation efflux family)
MKLIDTLIFSMAILAMMIGIHQSMMVGFAASYWLFMVSFGFLMWYQVRKKNRKEEAKVETSDKKESESPKKRKYKM